MASPKRKPSPSTPQQHADYLLKKGAERAGRGLTDFTRKTHKADLESMRAGLKDATTPQAERLREFQQEGTMGGKRPSGAKTGREREEERRRRQGR